jgi:hypothetical protein
LTKEGFLVSKRQKRQKLITAVLAGLMAALMVLPILLDALSRL